MLRTLLIAGVLLVSLPAALCEAACAPELAAPMAHAEAMPCHGAPQPTPSHDAEDCTSCQLEVAAARATVPVTAHSSASLAIAPIAAFPPAVAMAHADRSPRESPARPQGPYARTHAPLLI